MNQKRINDFLWKIEKLIDEIKWEIDILKEEYASQDLSNNIPQPQGESHQDNQEARVIPDEVDGHIVSSDAGDTFQDETEEILNDKDAMDSINKHKARKGDHTGYKPLSDKRGCGTSTSWNGYPHFCGDKDLPLCPKCKNQDKKEYFCKKCNDECTCHVTIGESQERCPNCRVQDKNETRTLNDLDFNKVDCIELTCSRCKHINVLIKGEGFNCEGCGVDLIEQMGKKNSQHLKEVTEGNKKDE